MIKKKRIAIITGASTGIGKHASIELSNNNYHVILIARNMKKLQLVEKIILEQGNDCSVISADISDEKSINKIYTQIPNKENVDVLVNNAGVGIFNKIENVSYHEWDQQINTNLKGSFLMTKMVVSDMIKRKRGKLIFVNSIAGLNPYPFSSVYVASKYGLTGFASSLREELREHNIKVISIHPGAIDTPFWDKIQGDFSREEMLSSKDVATSVVNAILAKNKVVYEQLVIRKTSGDIKS